MKILPHRYPFLLVDKVIEKNGTDSLVAIKNVTMNEEFFQGHFPGKPVMPGVTNRSVGTSCRIVNVGTR